MLFTDEKNKKLTVFRWALINTKNIVKAVDCNDIVKISPNDKYKLFFQPVKNSYIYLYLFNSSKNLYCLFPKNPDDFKNIRDKSYYNKDFMIPLDKEYFNFGEKSGKENIFILASNTRLKKLENLTARFLKLKPGNTISKIKKDETKQSIVHEIKKMINETSQYDRNPTRQEPYAGIIRGELSRNGFETTFVQTNRTYIESIFLAPSKND